MDEGEYMNRVSQEVVRIDGRGFLTVIFVYLHKSRNGVRFARYVSSTEGYS